MGHNNKFNKTVIIKKTIVRKKIMFSSFCYPLWLKICPTLRPAQQAAIKRQKPCRCNILARKNIHFLTFSAVGFSS
jgi:hypothetical protein